MIIQDLMLNLYNPAAQDPEQLLAEFIDRRHLLARILDIIRHNSPEQPQQHLILIGPRGMGKTTLLCAIKHSIGKDEALQAAWLPLLFHEEQYGIGDLADFWLETLRHLEAALNRPSRAAAKLLEENPEDLAQQAQARFFEVLAETGKRALLLIDNLNDIFQAIDDGHSLHQLRALWMVDPRCMVVGAAPSYFAEITELDQAFHDFFRAFRLDRLNAEEMEAFLRGYAEMLGETEAMARLIGQAPERVAALRILTGGNPRLVKLGYRVLRDGLDGDLRRDLERLLDEATPFFKHRIDSLKAKETRRVFDAIARRWDPISVDDIRRELRKPSNYVSAQIKRLIEEGFVEEISGDKKKRYQVSERFYNVYYLMRHSREGRKRLRWLVGFMQVLYSRKDYRHWAKRLENELAGALPAPLRAEKLAFMHAMSEAAGDGVRDEVFEALVRDAITHDERLAWDEDIAEGDPVETHGWRYLLAEVVWLLPANARRLLGFQPQDNSWWQRLRLALGETGLQQAHARIEALGGWRQDTPRHARAAGVILYDLFQRSDEAEVAYRKALELDPQYVFAWNNLGIALSGQNRYAEAEAAYRKALELDPQFASAWYNLGVVLSRQNRYAEAEAACRKALEFDPQYVFAWYNLGNALYGQNRYAEAEAVYRKALELDPQYGLTHINLSRIYLENMGRIEAGANELILGLCLQPENSYGLRLLSRHWQAVLPPAAAYILAHATENAQAADALRAALTEVLLEQAAAGEQTLVREALLALDPSTQPIFEPLLLALQAIDDRSLLSRIAGEMRELVLEVLARIGVGWVER
jgi:Flp pilus assembly protein TadD